MKVVQLPSLRQFEAVYEFVVSPDGEKIATVVEDKNSQRFLWVNENLIEEPFERIDFLSFSPDGRLMAAVQKDGVWRVFVEDHLWEEGFEYVWNLKTDSLGRTIAANVKQEGSYSVCVNGKSWETSFYDARDLYVSETGRLIATYVKVEVYPALDILNFSKGIWSLAVNQRVWEKKYIAIFGCCFNSTETSVAAAVRLSDRRFTIAVNGVLWDRRFLQVWEPRFLDEKSVIAPVKTERGWQLFRDGAPFWKGSFFQLWNIRVKEPLKMVAGIVALDLGEWTVIVNEKLWNTRFNQLVLPPVFSEDGQKVAVAFRHNGKWGVAVEDRTWENSFEKIGPPVFSLEGGFVAVRGEQGGKYYVYVNDKRLDGPYDYLWDPVFREDETLIIRGIQKNRYYKKELKI